MYVSLNFYQNIPILLFPFFSEMKFPLFERNVFYAQVFWPSDSLRLSLQCCCQSLPLLTEETLTPVDVFVLVSFNNMLTLCIGTYLGLALLEGYEAYASLGRIEEFLLLKNLRVISSDRSSQKETEIEAENPSEMKRNSLDCQKKQRGLSTADELQDQTSLRVRSLAYKQAERQDSYSSRYRVLHSG